MLSIGDDDYFTSSVGLHVFLAEQALSGVALLIVLGTVLLSSKIHRSAVSVSVYISCEWISSRERME
jgi:hypothetical protein